MPFIMLTVLIDMVAIGLIIPVLPQIVAGFTHSRSEQVAAYRMVSMAFAFANFIGAPVLGALSDRFGRRPVLLCGFAGLATSFFVTGLATEYWMLIAVRLFSGAVQTNSAIANAYVADITPPEDRGRRYGLLGAMFGLGFILGPVSGGLLGAVDVHLPFFVAGALAVCNFLYGLFVLPESLPPARRRPFDWGKANPVGSLRHLFGLRGVGALLAVVALSSLAQFMLHSTWALYTQLKFGWGPREIGLSLLAVGAMSVLGQGALAGPLTRRLGAPRLLMAGLVSSALCYFAWGAASLGWELYAAIFLNVVGFAASTAGQTVISNAADPNAQGRTLGAVAGLSSLMMAVAPVLGPLLMEPFADHPQGDWRIGAPYYLGGLLLAASAAIAAAHFARAARAARASGSDA